MAENVLTTKTINEINIPENRFFIPDYQRGYRWKEPEIHALLEDILAHIDRRPEPKRNYCLQPVVIAPREDGSWEVIDGQQRLTTIYVILRYLSPQDAAFSIELSTRKDSERFLEYLSSAEPDTEEDIDSFHIAGAWRTIDRWFDGHSDGRRSLKQKFFIGLSEKVEVIWYEIGDGSNHMDVFTRLNIGKIPLTNAELTKALLITSIAPDASRDVLALQWDSIEAALRDDRFWLYVNRDHTEEASRIDLLFRFHYEVYALKKEPPRDLDVFHYFETLVESAENKSAAAMQLWDRIRELFLRLSEWFENREIYHLTGYLITIGFSLVKLYRMAEGVPKSKFIEKLKQEIARSIRKDLKGRSIFDLNYLDDALMIRRILLLLNIVTEQQSIDPDNRFSFAQYKKHRWSLEHIHAQAAEPLTTDAERRQWLADHRQLIETLPENTETEQILRSIMDLESKRIVSDEFSGIQDKVFELMSSDEDADEVHGVENLALLDRETNSHLKNAVFAVKRHRIIDRDRSGHFILPTTRNVFLKYYSPSVDHLHYWSRDDREQYGTFIQKSLQGYFGQAILGGEE